MESYKMPSISTASLGNSLFECVTIDVASGDGRFGRGVPTIVKMGVICVCLRGSGKICINEKEYPISRGTLITMLPNSVIKGISSTDDFLGYAIAADTQFMMSIQISDAVKSFIHISSNPVLQINEEQTATIIELCEMLRRRREEEHSYFSKEISRHLLSILCYEIYGFYRSKISELSEPVGRSRQSSICQEFLELVEQYAPQHRDMGFYADKLCITPKYLSVVVRKLSGRSPIEWIDRSVMLYARTLLTTSDMTVQQVASELNFPNPSFFGQYFKRHEGVTPKRYRAKVLKDDN